MFVLLPLLSFGQDTMYYVSKGILMKSTKAIVANVPSFKEYGRVYKLSVTPSGDNTFVVRAKVDYGDPQVGFLLVHDAVVEKTFFNNNGKLITVNTEVQSKRSYIGSTCFFGLCYLAIFAIGFMSDNRAKMLKRWLTAKKMLFPFWEVMGRIVSLILYFELVPIPTKYYGQGAPTMFFNMTMPWVVATVLVIISFIVLIVKYVTLMVDFKFEMKPYGV